MDKTLTSFMLSDASVEVKSLLSAPTRSASVDADGRLQFEGSRGFSGLQEAQGAPGAPELAMQPQ